MKLSKLSNEYLSFMIKEYSKNHNKIFGWSTLKSLFPDENDDFICDALRVLSKDGLVHNNWADDIVYNCELDVIAIINAETNNTLKKTYKILKEIREWI